MGGTLGLTGMNLALKLSHFSRLEIDRISSANALLHLPNILFVLTSSSVQRHSQQRPQGPSDGSPS